MDLAVGYRLSALLTAMLITCFIQYTSAQYRIQLNQSSEVAEAGDTAVFTCDVFNDPQESFILLWVKKFNGEKEVEIATNDHVNEPFRTRQRYKATYNVVRKLTHIKFELTITDLKPGDSGDIGCRLPNEHLQLFRPFLVREQIGSVRIMSSNFYSAAAIYSETRSVVFRENERRSISCIANGSYPEPTVDIFLDGDNITQLFNRSSKLVRIGPTNGIQELYYRTELSNVNYVIGYEFHNKVLKCIARISDMSYPAVTTSITITLSDYAPKFECRNAVSAPLYNKDTMLRCVVKAKPPITEANFYWSVYPHENISLKAGEWKSYYYGYLNPGQSENAQEMVLKIERIFPQHFRSYFFEATNLVGKNIYEIQLIEDGTQQIDNGAISKYSFLITMCWLCLIITLLKG